MSDPFSVAGSAVGVISLGLSVCGKIVDYCRAYHGYDEDIRKVTVNAESLGEILQDLNDVIDITQTIQPLAAIRLSKKIVGIEEQIKRIESVLKRYGPDKNTEGFSQKARNQVKKSIYAFRKDALREMAADLDGLQKNLQTALEVHTLKQISQMWEEMRHMTRLITRDNGKMPPSLLRDCCRKNQQHRFDMTIESDDPSGGQPIKQTQARTTKRICSSSRWLGYVIGISFNMTTGAGGLSICPTLDVNPVIFSDNPGYQRIELLLDSINWNDNFDDDFEALQSSIADSRLDPSRTLLHLDINSIRNLEAKNVLLFEVFRLI
ncbi:hypothetical protein N7452_005325 [Penicillium brevicompactum]|uniref:Fungal N-terminal domain-containing protein n=1 Tax=Penicillium brevicompactum TaxID=5074 RepID=A0A9W9QIE6_PENBR|nr:hypothetical protein N7452_005325 [Penicillium brevicompactum]